MVTAKVDRVSAPRVAPVLGVGTGVALDSISKVDVARVAGKDFQAAPLRRYVVIDGCGDDAPRVAPMLGVGAGVALVI